MPKDYPRSDRVAERIKREIGQLIATEVKDPRVGFMSVTDVEVSSNLAQAKIYVSALGTDQTERAGAEAAAEALEKVAPFLRGRLSKLLGMRYTPNIRFLPDYSQADGDRISQLLSEAAAKRGPATPPKDQD